MRLSELAELARSLDATSFIARRPDPVLVPADSFPALERGIGYETPPRVKLPRAAIDFIEPSLDETSRDVVMSPLGLVAEATPPSGYLVRDPEPILVVKTDRNPFQQMITVGRAKNNDVVLDDKSVSKVHAYFVRTDFRHWLHDQPSTNGTYIDGARVPETGLPLADGASISFGSHLVFTFFTSRGLHQFLTTERQRPSPSTSDMR
jgi:hypothetical protein